MNSSEKKSEKETEKESDVYLAALEERERTKTNRIPGVQKVLVVLSSKGMVFDVESIRQKILLAYPEAAVFFRTTSGKPMGLASPQKVDLLIDLTGPGQRQSLFLPRRLKKMARFAVGRNAGLFRKRLYDRIYDEKTNTALPKELLERERIVQREVLSLAGVAFVPAGYATPDRGKVIALELPPLSRA